MNGLELSKSYFDTYGRDMLAQFPEVEPYLAVGLVGSGSECFGFDDEVSRDHDFEPGFCIFLPSEDMVDRKTAFQLERAYAKLPKEFEGIKRNAMSPVGGNRHGVLRMDEFYQDKVGARDGDLTIQQWLTLPEYMLAEATNGEVFLDNLGQFSAIRSHLSQLPEDIRLKKLAGHLLLMAQSGQYNYKRCLQHGETASAQLATVEFVNHTLAATFLLNRRYMPYYKWSFRMLSSLAELSELKDALEMILFMQHDTDEAAEEKYYTIEGIATLVIDELQRQEITQATCGDLEKHAYSVNDKIQDSSIRNLHILCAV